MRPLVRTIANLILGCLLFLGVQYAAHGERRLDLNDQFLGLGFIVFVLAVYGPLNDVLRKR